MSMEDRGQQFDQLQRLMKLKTHETPPPGYFSRFPDTVISQIRRDRRPQAGFVDRLEMEAPWLIRLWQKVAARPLFAGGFGVAICSLVLAGTIFSEKPANSPAIARQDRERPSFLTESTPLAGLASDGTLLTTITNQDQAAPPSLFDQVQPLQVVPVSTHLGE